MAALSTSCPTEACRGLRANPSIDLRCDRPHQPKQQSTTIDDATRVKAWTCEHSEPRPRAPFIGWVGYHSLDTEFIWAQYNLNFLGNPYDYCDVRVHVTDHNDGGRVNVNYAGIKYIWDPSCNISGPIAQVP